MIIKTFKLDAFCDKKFSGNQAAVCVLDKWIDDELMQNIAAENNLAETAFLVKNDDKYEIRWFTPLIEVELCGHATLASAYVLYHFYNETSKKISYHSHLSGELSVLCENENEFTLNFPTDAFEPVKLPNTIGRSFSNTPIECYKGLTDYMLVYKTQKEVEEIEVDFQTLKKAYGRGVMVTSPGDKVDFVSRFFAPQSGIDEDSVTGSAHTTLTPFWSNKLKKKKLVAQQLSARKGFLTCIWEGERTLISGKVELFLKGEILI